LLLIAEVERVGEPVDLVGHDWGFILATRVASVRPDLVRTLIGGSGPICADYEWHPLARIWQEEGAGEAWFDALDPEAFASAMMKAGVRAELARAEGQRLMYPSMQKSILALYRSSVNMGVVWERDLHRVAAATLLIWGEEDTAVPLRYAEQMRDHMGAELLSLDCGHFVPAERPAEYARAVCQHWERFSSL